MLSILSADERMDSASPQEKYRPMRLSRAVYHFDFSLPIHRPPDVPFIPNLWESTSMNLMSMLQFQLWIYSVLFPEVWWFGIDGPYYVS
jgi:hypothetical protein